MKTPRIKPSCCIATPNEFTRFNHSLPHDRLQATVTFGKTPIYIIGAGGIVKDAHLPTNRRTSLQLVLPIELERLPKLWRKLTNIPVVYDSAAAPLVAVNDLYKTQVTYRYRDPLMVVADHPSQSLSMEMDLEAAADWTVSFFQHFYNDETPPLFYEPMNESFVHAGNFGSDDSAVRLGMSGLYREIGQAFDESDFNVNVIGVTGQPSQSLPVRRGAFIAL